MSDNGLLVLLFVAIASGLGAVLSWACDWLEEHFPWEEM